MGILINPDEHPRLFKAIENILKVEWKMRHDAGNASLYETRPQYYEVPSHFQVNKIEKALATLTEDELEAFATGEQADKMSLRDRNPYIEEGYYLLTDILNDFPNFNALHTSVTVQESVGMTDAEARRICTEGEHTPHVYERAARVLEVCDERQLAYYAREIAKSERMKLTAEERLQVWRERAKNPRKADSEGTADDIKLIVNGAAGIYGPQWCLEKFSFIDFIGTISKEDWNTVISGPDEEFYWEAWENIERDGILILNPITLCYSVNGGNIEYTLFSFEGDIYLVPMNVDLEDYFT